MMTVSAISSTDSPYLSTLQSSFKQRKADFGALGSALQSGDLSGAQTAYAALQQDMQTIQSARQAQGTQSSGQSSQSPGQTNPVSTDIQALGSALQSGDLSGAQKAYASLLQDLQSVGQAHHHRHHHHHQGDATSTVATADNTTLGSGDTSGTTVNVQA